MDYLVNDYLAEFYKNKRILVTGDTGFKGSWLSLWLKELGAEVVGYALSPAKENDHFNLLKLDRIIQHVTGDVRNLQELLSVFSGFKPEIVFHLAAQPLVRLSYAEPKLTLDTNIGGSVNVLEAVRETESVKSLIFVTSDKCYANKEWVWGYRENDELGGHDPYSASKAAAEIVFAAYQKSFFGGRPTLGSASVRAGNVIGGGDWADDRIVPDSVRALIQGKPIILRNPLSTRPWQYVLEPLYGYILLAAKLFNKPQKYTGAWNFGPDGDSNRTVQELVERIIACWGTGSLEINKLVSAPHEAGLLNLNCDKARQLLGWQSRWNFEQTVEQTVKWYKEVSLDRTALSISIEQIELFMGGNL